MKTSIDIEDDIFTILKGSALAREVSGKIYKGVNRPSDSKKEDITIAVLANNNGEIQNSYVNVNIYVADQQIGKAYNENKQRARVLAKMAVELFDNAGKEHDFRTTVEEQRSYEADGTGVPEHFINVKIRYKTYNP